MSKSRSFFLVLDCHSSLGSREESASIRYLLPELDYVLSLVQFDSSNDMVEDIVAEWEGRMSVLNVVHFW